MDTIVSEPRSVLLPNYECRFTDSKIPKNNEQQIPTNVCIFKTGKYPYLLIISLVVAIIILIFVVICLYSNIDIITRTAINTIYIRNELENLHKYTEEQFNDIKTAKD
jgi:hypothetical protein